MFHYYLFFLSVICLVFRLSLLSTIISLILSLTNCVLHTNARLIYFLKRLFFRAVLGLQQNWEGDIEISHILLAPHIHNLLCYQHHIKKWYICDQSWTCIHTSLSSKSVRAHSWCCTFWVWATVLWYTSIIMHILQSVFIVLKSSVLPIYPSLPLCQPPIFIICTVSPLTECHMKLYGIPYGIHTLHMESIPYGITQYVAFSDRPPSLSHA